MALVSQEPTLFDCSIADNISYGLTGVSRERITEAAKLANIHDFVMGLPDVSFMILGRPTGTSSDLHFRAELQYPSRRKRRTTIRRPETTNRYCQSACEESKNFTLG